MHSGRRIKRLDARNHEWLCFCCQFLSGFVNFLVSTWRRCLQEKARNQLVTHTHAHAHCTDGRVGFNPHGHASYPDSQDHVFVYYCLIKPLLWLVAYIKPAWQVTMSSSLIFLNQPAKDGWLTPIGLPIGSRSVFFFFNDVHHWKDGKQGTRKQQIVDLVRLNPEDVKLIFIVLITFVITHYSFRGDLSS